MAFVYEVERPPLFDTNKATSDIGPGQYLPLTLYKFEKPSLAPFGAAAKRAELFQINKGPGPGAYNPKEDQNISYQYKNIYSEIYNNKNQNKDNKDKNGQMIKKKYKVINKTNIEYEKIQNKDNKGFFTKVERFTEHNKLNTPGPGTYGDKNILLAKSIEEKCYNNKEIIYKINQGRHNAYSVNRFDRQFPWNSEIINPNKIKSKKKKRNKSMEINQKMVSFKNIQTNDHGSIIISKLEKEKTKKSDISCGVNNIFSNGENTNKKNFMKLVDYNLSNNIKNNTNTENNNTKKSENIELKINTENKNAKNLNKSKETNKNVSKYKKISLLKKSKTSTNFFLNPRKENKEKDNKINDININNINNSTQKPKLTRKEIKQKLAQELKKASLQREMKYRISSIPSKFTAGYEIEKESGKMVRRPIKTYFKIFSGEKNDAVGPGSYEDHLDEGWRKTGTSWSKYLVKKNTLKLRPKSGLSNSNENKDIINYNKLDKHFNKVMKNNKGYYALNDKLNPKYNSNMQNLHKFYSTQHMFFHPYNNNIKIINKKIFENKLPDFIRVNDVPGPGYYYDEEKNNLNLKKGKNDLSKLKYAHLYDDDVQYENNYDEGGLGPGTYFNDIFNLNNNKGNKGKKRLLSDEKTKSAPFLCTSKRFSYNTPQRDDQYIIIKDEDKQYFNDLQPKILTNNDITADSSNTSNSTHKFGFNLKDKIYLDNDPSMMQSFYSKNPKFKSMNGTFYRRDMRFREDFLEENRKKEIPGPGSYISPYTSTGKTNTVKVDGRYMDIRSCRVLIEKHRENKFNKSKKMHKKIAPWLEGSSSTGPSPSVGTYEPDKTFTILYDINKNKKYGTSHFNSTQYSDRNGLFFFQKNAPNGPGSYYHDKFVEQKQISAAFNSTADRFFIGGKNNTKNLYDLPNVMMDISIKKNKDGESTVGLTEKIIQDRINENKSIMSHSSTPNVVGPGTYSFLPEVYPWVKQSYNTKFI